VRIVMHLPPGTEDPNDIAASRFWPIFNVAKGSRFAKRGLPRWRLRD
jgi:hypothetical protein